LITQLREIVSLLVQMARCYIGFVFFKLAIWISPSALTAGIVGKLIDAEKNLQRMTIEGGGNAANN